MSSAVGLREIYATFDVLSTFCESDIKEDEEKNIRNICKDTIVVNTNLYALTKDASAVGRKWQNIDLEQERRRLRKTSTNAVK
ncbi:1013_t:CDS:2, partial [Funneliformis mosseae]